MLFLFAALMGFFINTGSFLKDLALAVILTLDIIAKVASFAILVLAILFWVNLIVAARHEMRKLFVRQDHEATNWWYQLSLRKAPLRLRLGIEASAHTRQREKILSADKTNAALHKELKMLRAP